MNRTYLLILLGLLVLPLGCGDKKRSLDEIKPGTQGAQTLSSTNDDSSSKTDSPPPTAVTPPKVTHFDPPSEPPAAKDDVAKWIAQLAAADEATREAAEQALVASGGSAIPALLVAQKDKSPELRRAVTYFLLEKFPFGDSRISAAFREALADEERSVRQLALQAIKRMPTEELALAVPQIASLLDSSREEPVNRADAARLLGRLGAKASEALPALAKTAASDPSEKVRAPALYSVTKIAEAKQALPVLQNSLQNDKDPAVRLVAVSGLGRLGSEAATAASDLAMALDDKDEKVRRAAADALAGLEAVAVAPLVEKLASPNPRTRELALFTLGRLGPPAKSAASAIAKLATDEDPAVRALAEAVLESLKGI